jgi:hypothetical protein
MPKRKKGRVCWWVDPDKEYPSTHFNGNVDGTSWIQLEKKWLENLHQDRRYKVIRNKKKTLMSIKEI